MDLFVSQSVGVKKPTCGTLTMQMMGEALELLKRNLDPADVGQKTCYITSKQLLEYKTECLKLNTEAIKGKTPQEIEDIKPTLVKNIGLNIKWTPIENIKFSITNINIKVNPLNCKLELSEDLEFKVEPLEVNITFRTKEDRPQSDKLLRV